MGRALTGWCRTCAQWLALGAGSSLGVGAAAGARSYQRTAGVAVERGAQLRSSAGHDAAANYPACTTSAGLDAPPNVYGP